MKSNSPHLLLNEKVNFNKNEAESKIENKKNGKSKKNCNEMKLTREKRVLFSNVHFVLRKFFVALAFISMFTALNKL